MIGYLKIIYNIGEKMKKVKYMISILLIISGFLFTGELFIYFLDNFQESYYRANFVFDNLPDENTNPYIVEEFLLVAQETGVDFFIVDSNIVSDYEKYITVYGTENAIKALKNRKILDKEYEGLFTGKTKVRYLDFEKVENIKRFDNFYFIGENSKLENMRAFKKKLINEYGGGFPRVYGSDRSLYTNLFLVWGTIFILLTLLNVYEVIFQKKEIVIRLLLGEDLKIIFLKNILMDIVVFSLMFLFLPKILINVSNVFFEYRYVITLYLIFILVSILIHASVFHINLKKDFANSKNSKTFLAMNYFLKIITTMLSTLLLAGNISILAEGINYYRQKDFFETNKEYCYYQLNYKIKNSIGKTGDDCCLVMQKFYQQYKSQSLQYIDLTNALECTYPFIVINKNSRDEVLKENPDMKNSLDQAKEDKYYFLIPDAMSENDEELNKAKEVFRFYFVQENSDDIEIIKYKDSLTLMSINYQLHLYRSKLIKNPIILLDNHSKIQEDLDSASRQLYYAYDIMYNIKQDDFDNFIQENQLENQIVVKTNVYELYQYNWKIIKRSVKLISVFSAFLILIQMSLIVFIIKIEYKVNSVEIAIKKVLGYNRLERNRKIFYSSLITMISISVSIILCLIFHIEQGVYLLISSVAIGLFEWIYIQIKISSVERSRIATILKGERL